MIQFCIALHHGMWTDRSDASGLDRVVSLTQTADKLGFDSAWVTEDPDGWDSFVLLGHLSAVTTAIRLGPGVVNPFMRHPNLIAASVATLDRVSRGRAFLGIGRGQPEWYQRRFDFDTSAPLTRLETTIDLLRQWWHPPYIARSDTPPLVHEWERVINPAQSVPIYVAAVGQRALQMAGRKADGVLFNELATPTFVRDAIATVRNAADQAGRDPVALSFFVNPASRITDDPATWLEKKKTFVATVHALPGMDQLLRSPNFDTDAIMAGVRTAMRTDEALASGGGFSDLRRTGDLAKAKELIPTALVDEASAMGSAAVVAGKLRAFIDAGATHLFFSADGITGSEKEVAAVMRTLNSGNSQTPLQ